MLVQQMLPGAAVQAAVDLQTWFLQLCESQNQADPTFCLQESQSFPESYPELPKKDTVESSQLQKHVLELAAMLEVQNLFWEEPQETY